MGGNNNKKNVINVNSLNFFFKEKPTYQSYINDSFFWNKNAVNAQKSFSTLVTTIFNTFTETAEVIFGFMFPLSPDMGNFYHFFFKDSLVFKITLLSLIVMFFSIFIFVKDGGRSKVANMGFYLVFIFGLLLIYMVDNLAPAVPPIKQYENPKALCNQYRLISPMRPDYHKYMHKQNQYTLEMITTLLLLLLWTSLTFKNQMPSHLVFGASPTNFLMILISLSVYFYLKNFNLRWFIIFYVQGFLCFFIYRQYSSKLEPFFLQDFFKYLSFFLAASWAFLYQFTRITYMNFGLLYFLQDTFLVLYTFTWCSIIYRECSHLNPQNSYIASSIFYSVVLMNFFFLKNDRFYFVNYIIIMCLACASIVLTANSILNLGLLAAERRRRVTMFEPGPEVIHPNVPKESIFSFGNAYFIGLASSKTLTLLALLAIYPLSPTYYVFVYAFVFSLNALVWLWFYTSAQLTENYKTSDIRDWRGVFLATHQYHWPASTLVLSFLLSLITLGFLFACAAASLWKGSETSITAFIVVFTTIRVGVFTATHTWKFWLNVITFFQGGSASYWNDSFWFFLSPFLRDWVYWSPIDVNGFASAKPYRLGYLYKASVNTVLSICWCIFLVALSLHFGVWDNWEMYVLVFYVKIMLIYWFFLMYVKVIRSDYTDDEFFLKQFKYFESVKYFIYGMVLLLIFAYFFYS